VHSKKSNVQLLQRKRINSPKHFNLT